jgi:hypothetical protein
MRHTGLFLIVCLIAGLAPFWPVEESRGGASISFPGWPKDMAGVPLRELPLSPQEEAFAKSFPGCIGRFTDGESEYVIRWVTSATRRLHPASDCLRGSGYQIEPLPLHVDSRGAIWGSLEASNGTVRLQVQERITGPGGQSWSDVSSWYWAAVLGKTRGPWWAITRSVTLPLPGPDIEAP